MNNNHNNNNKFISTWVLRGAVRSLNCLDIFIIIITTITKIIILIIISRQKRAVPTTGVPRGVQPPSPPKFLSFEKAGPNSQFSGIYVWNNLIRIWGSLIYKLSETPTRGYCPPIPVLSALCPKLNLLNTPPPPTEKKFLGTLLVPTVLNTVIPSSRSDAVCWSRSHECHLIEEWEVCHTHSFVHDDVCPV
jgi:hypothetical protein